ncbi:hypothetical protein [Jiangella rhizosphaerae]|uniref:hypothetical protein n=1 Tax=Jiangella rhizosphaerae TaxID=2293569 RepID=UPI001314810B|nr:hypothetical protein [Jiangella rhizosphaerae]
MPDDEGGIPAVARRQVEGVKTFGAWLGWDDAHAALAGRLSAADVDRLAAAYAFAADPS